MKPTIGRIVNYVVRINTPWTPEDKPTITVIPAIIVAVWGDSCINVRIFHDGSNTDKNTKWSNDSEWKTSISLDEAELPQINTWHWPKKV